MERILQASEREIAVASALSLLESTCEPLDAVGFHSLVYEDFYDVLYGLIKSIVQPDDGELPVTLAVLLETFQDPPSTVSPGPLDYF